MPSPSQAQTQPDVPRRSLIKPQLLNVSTSGTLLDGVIVERNRERAR